jgi:hypothetical protein
MFFETARRKSRLMKRTNACIKTKTKEENIKKFDRKAKIVFMTIKSRN